jgi:hypothetical protein
MASKSDSQDRLLSWYARRRPFRVDIVGDYAGSSPFLIDGDSLLRQIFSDARIDFAAGFQLLHAVYSIEQFLENLRRRNCVFDIVFFEQHSKICIPAWNVTNAWKYVFARQAVIKHLGALKRDGDAFVFGFKSTRDEAFASWLEKRRPLFVMAHDGEDILEDTPEVADVAKEWEIKAMIYSFMHTGRGYNVALINSIVWEDSKVLLSSKSIATLRYRSLHGVDSCRSS